MNSQALASMGSASADSTNHGFNQLWIGYCVAMPMMIVSVKNTKTFSCHHFLNNTIIQNSNYLHRIYIVLDIISNQEMV
jgi:hypothetical protein